MKETKPAFAVIILIGFCSRLSSTPGHAQTLDEVYQKALTEAGPLTSMELSHLTRRARFCRSLKRAFLE